MNKNGVSKFSHLTPFFQRQQSMITTVGNGVNTLAFLNNETYWVYNFFRAGQIFWVWRRSLGFKVGFLFIQMSAALLGLLVNSEACIKKILLGRKILSCQLTLTKATNVNALYICVVRIPPLILAIHNKAGSIIEYWYNSQNLSNLTAASMKLCYCQHYYILQKLFAKHLIIKLSTSVYDSWYPCKIQIHD